MGLSVMGVADDFWHPRAAKIARDQGTLIRELLHRNG